MSGPLGYQARDTGLYGPGVKPCFEPLEPKLLLSTMTINSLAQFAALDNSADDNDPTPGIFEPVDDDLVIATGGSINNNDDWTNAVPNSSARPIVLNVRGNMTMEAGSGIYAENRNQGGTGGDITIGIGGFLYMQGTDGQNPGAIISSSRIGYANAGTKNAGNITIIALGTITMEDGSVIRANDPGGRAGDIFMQSGGTGVDDPSGHMLLDGLISSGPTDVLLDSRLTGFVLERGNTTQHGGRIILNTEKPTPCSPDTTIEVSTTGVIVSQGEDPASDLIVLRACDVEVFGLVASVAKKSNGSPGNYPHVVILADPVLINGSDLGSDGPNQGRVRADYIVGEDPITSRIDIYARKDIIIIGPASGSMFAVGSNGGDATNMPGGKIAVMSLEGMVSATGMAIQADGIPGAGSDGGMIDIRAAEDVLLDGASLYARGDYNATGGYGVGGTIYVRSFNGGVSWTDGVGDVRPTGIDTSPVLSYPGTITLVYNTTIDTTGTSFPTGGTSPLPPIVPFPDIMQDTSGGSPVLPPIPDWGDYPNVYPDRFDLPECCRQVGEEEFDFGDNPDPLYPTVLLSDGARHLIVPGFFLGAFVDAEFDGQPSVGADGDDLSGVPDDEDGVVFNTPFVPGLNATMTITASMPGLLDAWIDWNADGDWNDAGEQIAASLALAAGPNVLIVPVPLTAVVHVNGAPTYSRFRFSSAGGLTPTGLALDGEVEDYLLRIFPFWTDKCAVLSQVSQNMGGNCFAIPDVLVDVDSGPVIFDESRVGTLAPATNSIQAAVDYVNAHGDVSGDGYLFVAVTAKDTFHVVTCSCGTFVGRYLGGDGTENVVITNVSGSRLNVFGNSVNIHAADPSKPVVTIQNSVGKVTALDVHAWDSSVAGYFVTNNADLVVVKNTRAINNNVGIWVKDDKVEVTGSPEISHGSIGILVEGNNVTLRTNNMITNNTQYGIKIVGSFNESNGNDVGVVGRGNGAGIDVTGNSNNLHDDNITGNAGTAIRLVGSSNIVNGEDILSNGGAGVIAVGNLNQVTGNRIFSNAGDGINVAGSKNLVKKNTVGEKGKGNGGSGIVVTGGSNTIQENRIYANLGDGIRLTGDANTVYKNIVGDKNKGGNGGNGIVIEGKNNTIQENTANANKLVGFYVKGATSTGNKFKNNKSNTDAAGGGNKNLLAQYKFEAIIVNQGGNRKNNVSFTSTAIGTYV